jgi:hypothetical protein
MIKSLILILIAITTINRTVISAQDTLILNDGRIILGNITQDDETLVNFTMTVKNKEVSTQLNKNKIKEIRKYKPKEYVRGRDYRITRERTFYYQGDKRLFTSEVEQELKRVPKAYQNYKNARANQVAAGVFAYSGGFILGYSISGIIFRNRRENVSIAPLMVGSGLTIIGLIFDGMANAGRDKALMLYNNTLPQGLSMGKAEGVEVKFSGTGLYLNF